MYPLLAVVTAVDDTAIVVAIGTAAACVTAGVAEGSLGALLHAAIKPSKASASARVKIFTFRPPIYLGPTASWLALIG